MDRQYRKTPGLQKRVEALVEETSVEQGLIALREARGLSQRALGLSRLGQAGSARGDGERDLLRSQRRLGQTAARRVLDRVGDGGRRRNDRGLADAAGAEGAGG